MVRTRTLHRCAGCGATSPRWSGRCASCGTWNSLVEEAVPTPVGRSAGATAGAALPEADAPVPIVEVDAGASAARPTGVRELDRVLGGGLVAGSVTVVGGEPGIGKSTLLVQALAAMARAGSRCLLVSAEESRQQVRLRAERLRALEPSFWLSSEAALPALLSAADDLAPDCLVVDSIQTVFDPEVGSGPGSVTQVRECAHRLVRLTKARLMTTVIVGHVTKDGSLAGPRVLEHVVDTVLSFEGDRHHALRLLRAHKHRFGPTGELGLLEMTGRGLVGVPDASGRLLNDRRAGAPGSVVVPTIEGRRPLLVELQVLAAPSKLTTPRRSAQGVDGGRLAMMLAVLDRRAGVGLVESEVYASAVGGIRVAEPAADLALVLALASAARDRPLPERLVACGEVGLAGEVRQVGHLDRRLGEAARLGFTEAMVPASTPPVRLGLRLHRVSTVAEAVAAAGLSP